MTTPATALAAGARRVAGAVCGAHALALGGIAAYYLVRLATGGDQSAARVLMSAVLIVAFAVVLGVMAVQWFGGVRWVRTPTIVWCLLLLPVAVSLGQAGDWWLAAVVGISALIGVLAAAGSERRDPA